MDYKRDISVKRNNMRSIYFIIFLLVFMISNVCALGISPGRTTIQFESGLEKEIEFNIINNEHKYMDVIISSMMVGDLKESISLFDGKVEFLPSEEKKTLKYRVKLPEELSPGLHIAEIIAVQSPKEQDDGLFVGATIAVVSQLYVYVPCPGKCIEADLEVMDAEENTTVTFIVPVISRGKLGIGEVRAIIDIYDLMGNKVGSSETNYLPLDSGARVELTGKWKANVPIGDYNAKITILYDGESAYLEKKFSIGVKTLSIESILVNDFVLGEIAKIRILVENRWNQELKNVYADLSVYNNEKQVMANVKSAPEDIAADSKKELVAYWDTVGVKEGEYEGKLYVRYGDKSSDKNLLLRVSANSLDISGIGYAVRGNNVGGGINIVTILTILVVLLLIVNIAWFIFYKRNSNKNKR